MMLYLYTPCIITSYMSLYELMFIYKLYWHIKCLQHFMKEHRLNVSEYRHTIMYYNGWKKHIWNRLL